MSDGFDIVVTDGVATSIAPNLDKIGESARNAGNQFNQFNTQFNQTNAQFNAFSTTINNTTNNFNRFNQTINNTSLSRLQQQMNAATSGVGSLQSALSRISSLAGLSFSVHGIAEAADEYVNLQDVIATTATKQTNVNDVMSQLFGIANRNYVPIQKMSESFSNLDKNMAQLGYTQQDTLKVLETITGYQTAYGEAAGHSSRAIQDLTRGMAQGALTGRELGQIAKEFPEIANQLSSDLGVPIAKFKDLQTTGGVAGKALVNAMEEISGKVQELAAQRVPTLTNAFTVLHNKWIETIGGFNDSTGVFSGIARGIISIASNATIFTSAVTGLGVTLAAAFGPAALAGLISFAGVFAVPAVILGGIAAITTALLNLTVVTDGAGKKGTTLGDAWKAVFDTMAENVTAMTSSVISAFSFIERAAVSMFKTLEDSSWLNSLEDHIKKYANDIGQAITATNNYTKQLLGPVANFFANADRSTNNVGIGVHNARSSIPVSQRQLQPEDNSLSLLEQFQQNAELERIKRENTERKGLGSAGDRSSDNVGTPTNKAAEKFENAWNKIIAKLNDTGSRMLENPEQRNVSAQVDQIKEQFIGKGTPLNDNQVKTITQLIQKNVELQDVQKAGDKIWEQQVVPIKQYNAEIQAADNALSSGLLSQVNYSGAIKEAKEAYQAATNPAAAYTREIQKQIVNLQSFGDAQKIAETVQQRSDTQLKTTGRVATPQDKAVYASQTQALIDQQRLNTDLNKIYDETVGKLQQINTEIKANNIAAQQGLITQQQASNSNIRLELQKSNTNLASGKGNVGDIVNSAGLKGLQDFQNVATSIASALGNMFSQLEDGIASSLAQALVSGKSLEASMQQLAKTVGTDLVQALIKAAEQWALFQALGIGSNPLSVSTPASSGSGGIGLGNIGSIFSGASSLSNLFGGGASSAGNVVAGASGASDLWSGASAAGGAATGTSGASSLLGGVLPFLFSLFDSGGYTGNGGTTDPAGVVHGQEFVMNAQATKRIGAGNLQKLQNGAPLQQASPMQMSPPVVNTNVSVTPNIINVTDPNDTIAAIGSSGGEKAIMNIIQRNPSAIKRSLGVA